jgi:formylglycine-generating enzyme required for sulfatase activity
LNAAAPVAVTRPARPYPGLRPFEQDEWSIFFGREQMIDEVIDRLGQNRLVLIHGVSGSGKSSLVRAGVLPKLALQYRRHDAPWLTCDMRPSGGPLWNLASAFARLEKRADDVERIGAIAVRFNARSATLAGVAASLEGVKGKSVCILVDQFEELFRYEREKSRDEAVLFVDLIERAARENAGDAGSDAVDLHIIITMRSEFLGECSRFAGFAETINRTQYLVPRMDDDGLMRAVRRPAQMYGGEFEEGLAERLIASVRGREDELPLLQHGLMLMWEDALRRAKSDERARLDGAIVDQAGGLAELLSQHADKVMASAAPDERRQKLVKGLFQALTGVTSEGAAIRRPLPFRKLCAVVGTRQEGLRPLLDTFRAPGVSFLTPYGDARIDDKTPIDISHEALIRCWRRINDNEGWLQEEIRDGLAWRTLLFQAETFASDRSNYLSPAVTEAGASRLRQRNEAWSEHYGGGWSNVEELVGASREHWKREAEKEEASRQKEIENERLRREAAEQSEFLAKKSELMARRLARSLQALVGILVVAVFMGAAAWWNQDWLKEKLWEKVYAQLKVTPLTAAREHALGPGDSFAECNHCPEMVVVPAGGFTMGSPSYDSERPTHGVTIAKPFAIAKFALTFDEWDACATHGDCVPNVNDSGWGRGPRPAINVSWEDAQRYVKWLSRITTKPYRLLSEAEYEYAARAGTETEYAWGRDITSNGEAMANCAGCGSRWDHKETAPVGSFPANLFSLYDMVGNVSEWTEDCWHDNYDGAPTDGSAWTRVGCSRRVVRGGSWYNNTDFLRSASRHMNRAADPDYSLGFRIARTLTP